jgi:hypothetical protein
MIATLKRAALKLLGLAHHAPDRDRQRLAEFDRAQLHRVMSNAGQTPAGSSWATTQALRTVALRAYDRGQIKPLHIQEIN